jgi:hypothetical protein
LDILFFIFAARRNNVFGRIVAVDVDVFLCDNRSFLLKLNIRSQYICQPYFFDI